MLQLLPPPHAWPPVASPRSRVGARAGFSSLLVRALEAHRPWSCADPSGLLSPHIVRPVTPGRGGSLPGKREPGPSCSPFSGTVWMKYSAQRPGPPQGCPNNGAMPTWPDAHCPVTGGCGGLVSCLRIHSCSYVNFTGVQGRRSDCRNVQDPPLHRGYARKKEILERNSKITPILKKGTNLGQKGDSQQPAHRSPSGNLQSRAPP